MARELLHPGSEEIRKAFERERELGDGVGVSRDVGSRLRELLTEDGFQLVERQPVEVIVQILKTMVEVSDEWLGRASDGAPGRRISVFGRGDTGHRCADFRYC